MKLGYRLWPASGIPFNLGPISAPVAKAGVGEPLLQSSIAGKQQEAFAVGIQPTSGIDIRNLDEISQAAPGASSFRGELAQDPVGLVEQQGGQGPSSGFAGFPEVDGPNGDQQQPQIHGNGREDHALALTGWCQGT